MDSLHFQLPTRLTQLITAEQAYTYRLVPVKNENGTITCKTAATELVTLQHELQILLGKEVELLPETEAHIQQYLFQNYRKKNTANSSSLVYSEDFLLTMILEASSIGSSDLHMEIFEQQCRVRFRIDGKLLERYLIPPEEYPIMVNRIKIMGGMDIAEKRLPQDGRITIPTGTTDIDIRVATLPTLHGEKIVLRLLSEETASLDLEDLGFTEKELDTYRDSIRKNHGIVLISGPTGSGKTTTLYATLKELNNDTTNILTVEDPIEYTLDGVNQVALKEAIGLDFASTLRTFLRQDPDIIMVGEIRDRDTANMAIRASLTGHLVLATIHTNSAWATVARLIDMGIPPFLVAATLNLSVAQRLLRKLCQLCKKEAELAAELFPKYCRPPAAVTRHYLPVGCPHCHGTGYRGRTAIYELLPMDKELANSVKHNALDISDHIKKEGIETLRSNAFIQIQEGNTSIEEAYPLLTNSL